MPTKFLDVPSNILLSVWFGFGVLFFAMKTDSAAFPYINEARKVEKLWNKNLFF